MFRFRKLDRQKSKNTSVNDNVGLVELLVDVLKRRVDKRCARERHQEIGWWFGCFGARERRGTDAAATHRSSGAAYPTRTTRIIFVRPTAVCERLSRRRRACDPPPRDGTHVLARLKRARNRRDPSGPRFRVRPQLRQSDRSWGHVLRIVSENLLGNVTFASVRYRKHASNKQPPACSQATSCGQAHGSDHGRRCPSGSGNALRGVFERRTRYVR